GGQGRDREKWGGAAIDDRTVMPNGMAINGRVELRGALTARPAMFAQAFAEKLMMYALSRKLEYFDMPQVRAIVARAAKDNYRWSTIVLGIVNSEAFRKQRPSATTKASGAKESAANNN